MAITQISRIQHRRGLKEQLPQLSAGELGFAVDTQELFIGNGTTADGAPEVGNTKIITEDDNILSVANTYTFRGNTDNPVVTGVDSNSKVVRTLQQKLDDWVSVKDFGAIGDGIADDTAAVNRAIANTYTVDTTTAFKERRTLYFPGGTYLIKSQSIKFYPHATILGDGPTSTILKSNDNTLDYVFEFADRNGNTRGNIGNDGAENPNGIRIQGVCFKTAHSQNIMNISQTHDLHFTECHWIGGFTNQTGNDSTLAKSAIELFTTAAHTTRRISFSGCTFEATHTGIESSDDIEDIFINSSEFVQMHRAINLAEQSDGSTANKVTGPSGVVLTSTRFDNIDVEAVKIHANGGNPAGNVVQGCSFRSVGKFTDDSSDVPSLVFNNGHNFAYGNFFHRDGDVSEFAGNIYHESPVEVSVTLSDNQAAAVNVTDINSNVVQHDFHRVASFQYHYTVTRGAGNRTGTITITGTSSSFNLTDDFTQNSDVGIVFSVTSSGILQYTSTSTGSAATMKYLTRTFV